MEFYHIHGRGIESCTADAHKGQALGQLLHVFSPNCVAHQFQFKGLGMHCQSLCKASTLQGHYCPYERHRLLSSLNAYDHLRRFFRLCVTHFKRHVHKLRDVVSLDVRLAMLSLASSQPHPDLEAAYSTIRNGGKKAAGRSFFFSHTRAHLTNSF